MDELPADPRTAARIEAIRAACALPVAHVHGSLEGRADGEVLAAAIEPDGRHAALVLRDAVERWDLDALEPVGRWDAPPPGYVNHAACVAPAPGGLRMLSPDGLWRLNDVGDAWRMLAPLEWVDTSVQSWGDVFAPDGAARELLRRPRLGPGEAGAIDSHQHALSRDGRLLWRIMSRAAAGTTVTVVALDAPVGDQKRWRIDAWHVAHCAGTSLLAVATFDHALQLLAANGASTRTPWPRGCVPLAFAPDDGALWVRDVSGLVVELAVPAELRAPASSRVNHAT